MARPLTALTLPAWQALSQQFPDVHRMNAPYRSKVLLLGDINHALQVRCLSLGSVVGPQRSGKDLIRVDIHLDAAVAALAEPQHVSLPYAVRSEKAAYALQHVDRLHAYK